MLDWALFLESTSAEGQPCKENTLVSALCTSIPSTQELGFSFRVGVFVDHANNEVTKGEACGITHRRQLTLITSWNSDREV